MEGFLAETIVFNEIPDWPYGEPDARFYEPQLREQNDIRTQQAQHRRRFNTQMLYEQGAIKDSELAKAERNIEASWIKTLPGGTQKILPKPIPPLPADVYVGERLVVQDLNEMIGFSESQRGSGGPVERTATETSIIESRARLRSGERQQAVERFLQRILEKLWIMMRQRLPRHRVEEILGRPAPEWTNIGVEEAIKELDIQIVTNSTLPKLDRLTRAQQDIQLIQSLIQWSPVLAPQGRIIDIAPLVDEVLEMLDHKVTSTEIIKFQPAAAMSTMAQQNGGLPTGVLGAMGGSPAAPAGPAATPAEQVGQEFS